MEALNIFSRAGKATVGAVAAFFLGLHVMIQLLVYAIAFDIVTGLIAAWMDKSIDSAVSRRGMGKKLMELLGVAAAEIVGRQLDIEVTAPWGGVWGLGAAVAGYYCVHEALSITENLARAGVPMPDWALGRLKQIVQEHRDG